ncbi:MAG: peptide MFS transporter, partial [Planctomycetota bacterium JB042]
MLTGHPKGLFRLFFIEMWERLAFYTMVGILLLYTIDRESGGLGYPKVVGNEIYGLYLAFVYFTPYLGGILADRFLGYRRSVLIGGVLFATGFFLMSMGLRWSFVTGLVCLCLGNGFFKPNISAMVGNLYEPGDPKRDAGFNIFYMGINIGAFIANFLAAVMRNKFNWEAIFVAAGVGMLIGITILLASWKVLEKADRVPETKPEDTPFREIMGKILGPAVLLGVAGYFIAKQLPSAVTDLVRPSDIGFLVGAIPIILFFVNLSKKAEEEEKPGLLALLPIYVAGGTFFMVLHLNGSAMTTWANENTDRRAEWVAENLPLFAGEAYPGYYKNADPNDPRPNKATLLPLATTETANMFGQKRMDDETLAALSARLPADVTVEEIPAQKEDRSDEQSAWSRYAVDVFEDVEVKEIVDSHGKKEITVNVADDAEKLRTVAFVRAAAEGRHATYLVTPEKFDSLYASDPPELPAGKYRRTANAELY